MTGEPRSPRPKALLDALAARSPSRFSGRVWRVVTDGYDPLRPSRAGGRWDDGTFDVLYTSREREGALAEAWFHISRGQPIVPSKPRKRLFQIEAELGRVLDLSGEGVLADLGVNMAAYGRLDYLRRTDEYPTLQQIAESVFFLDYEAIIAPSARWPASNVVIFTEHTRPTQLGLGDSELVDLIAWGAAARRRSLP